MPNASRSAVREKPTDESNDEKLKQVIPRNLELVGSRLEAASLFKSPYYLPSYQFPYNPDPLCRGNNYKIYDEMLDDDQVKAALAVKKDMVINTGWQIISPDNLIKTYLTTSLKHVNQSRAGAGGFDDVLRQILSAYEYGFSLSEPVYRLDEDAGLWTISELLTRPPHSFTFQIDDRGKVLKINQLAGTGFHSFEPDLFIHHVYQTDFGNPYGKSDLRAAHASWVSKKFIMRFYNIYLERYASPLIVGKYKGTFSAGDVSGLLDILQNVQQNTAMVIPEEAMVDFVQQARDGSTSYGDAMDKYDTKIARAILMPDLLGFSGSKTSGGSYSLGREQFKAFLGVIKKDRESLQENISEHIVKPLVAINWGPEAAAETFFEFIPFSDDSIIDSAKVWADAVRSVGWEPSDEEINHLRAITGFPEGDVERKQPQPNPLNPQQNPNDDDDDDDKNEDQPKKFSLRFYASRNLTIYEKKVDFGGITNVLNQSERRAIPALERVAKMIMSDLIAQVREKGLLRKFKPEAVNTLQPKFLKQMDMVFKNHFTDLFKEGMRGARAEIYKDKRFATDDTMFPEDFLDVLKAESFKTVGDYSTELTKRAKNIVIQGIKDGVGEGSIVTLLREEMGSFTERWLGTVVRTKTTEIYNDARKSFWDTDPVAKDIIEAYQFSAILDDRTSDVCRELDGKIFDKGAFLNQVTPPVHMNCRSLLVPVTRFEPYQDNDGYVKPGQEPSFEKIRDLGGNLVVGL